MITQMVQVTYRAAAAGGGDAAVRFVADPAQATMGDAWSRLSALYPGIDPMSLEIELRELQPGSAFQPIG
jgi:hypothetical protein